MCCWWSLIWVVLNCEYGIIIPPAVGHKDGLFDFSQDSYHNIWVFVNKKNYMWCLWVEYNTIVLRDHCGNVRAGNGIDTAAVGY